MTRTSALWTFTITSIALFMVTLDNLVVTMALPVIREDLGASIEGLEWTVNAYTLTFAVLLLTGAALGDRFGRRGMFVAGMAVFILASAAAALAPTIEALIAARAVQGVGGAIVDAADPDAPLGGSVARPPRAGARGLGRDRRACGCDRPSRRRGGRRGDVVAVDLLAQRADRPGRAAVPASAARGVARPGPGARPARPRPGQRRPLRHRLGTRSRRHLRLDEPRGLGRHRGGRRARGGLRGLGSSAPGRRCSRCASSGTEPSRPRTSRRCSCSSGCSDRSSCWRSSCRSSRATRRSTPASRTLPWTAMPIFIAPIAGALSDRIGGRPLMVTGLALQGGGLAWLAAITEPDVAYLDLVPRS